MCDEGGLCPFPFFVYHQAKSIKDAFNYVEIVGWGFGWLNNQSSFWPGNLCDADYPIFEILIK